MNDEQPLVGYEIIAFTIHEGGTIRSKNKFPRVEWNSRRNWLNRYGTTYDVIIISKTENKYVAIYYTSSLPVYAILKLLNTSRKSSKIRH